MTQNPLVEQAKEGNITAIASLMNRLLKSQGMLANVERTGDRLDILIESDLRSLDDEMRTPKRQVLVGMLKKWFLTLEVQNVSNIVISWQQAGAVEPAWTEEVALVETEIRLAPEPQPANQTSNQDLNQDINQNSGGIAVPEPPKLPPLPVFPPKPMAERSPSNSDRPLSLDAQLPIPPSNKPTPDLDEMFGELDDLSSIDNTAIAVNPLMPPPPPAPSREPNPSASPEPSGMQLSDVPAETGLATDAPNSPALPSMGSFSWQTLLTTPSVPFQFLQYFVVCAIIFVGLRGIHGALGGGAKAKPSAIAPNPTQLFISVLK